MTESSIPARIMRVASPIAWAPVEQADETDQLSPRVPSATETFAEAVEPITCCTVNG